MTTIDLTDSFDQRLRRAGALIRGASKITAFTGAGISTESGLSDFRSPGGVWDRHRIVTYQEFVASAGARQEYWRMKHDLYGELRNARPNRAHRALATLERMGKLRSIITQNIDGLHQEAGHDPSRVIELHGTNRKAVCLQCEKSWPISEVHASLAERAYEPRCDECAAPIKPATISFGQAMPEEEVSRAFREAGDCDLLLMIGSSLQVQPAASIPVAAHEAGAALIFMNRTETPLDALATVVFREEIGEVLEELSSRLLS